MKPSILAMALALSVSACGGGSSDRQEQAPSKTTEAQPASPLSIEWTEADLETNAARIGYGSKPAEIVARSADGALVFTPQTARDHVATAFTPVPAYAGDRSLEVLLDVKSPGGEGCLAHLQDQAYNELATVPCGNAGEQRATAKLPDSVTSVRVYFMSPDQKPLPLPARMQLIEHR
jgi:hypothetical protein